MPVALTGAVQRSPGKQFSRVWTASAGAGPLANAQSCAACHATPRLGGGGTSSSLVTLSLEETDPTGGHLFRQFLIRPGRAIVRRPLPRRVFHRRPPSLLGIGLFERVAPEAIAAHADADDQDSDGVSGRIPAGNGRFGWKARFTSVEQAVAAALVNELGLSNSLFRDHGTSTTDIGEADVRALVAFVKDLRPPSRKPAPADGSAAFEDLGCASCHVPQLPGVTDRRGAPVEAFTDLLLHDMGAALADLQEGDAAPEEFRTAPLWGVGASDGPYLHDGRAPTLDAAIRAHDGEARSARRRYEQAAPAQRAALLRFLTSL
jgi:CxxC motif-containing protein (DUF1111 family)